MSPTIMPLVLNSGCCSNNLTAVAGHCEPLAHTSGTDGGEDFVWAEFASGS
jgi:hypothetical protein